MLLAWPAEAAERGKTLIWLKTRGRSALPLLARRRRSFNLWSWHAKVTIHS
jgi:hypothetical protein